MKIRTAVRELLHTDRQIWRSKSVHFFATSLLTRLEMIALYGVRHSLEVELLEKSDNCKPA